MYTYTYIYICVCVCVYVCVSVDLVCLSGLLPHRGTGVLDLRCSLVDRVDIIWGRVVFALQNGGRLALQMQWKKWIKRLASYRDLSSPSSCVAFWCCLAPRLRCSLALHPFSIFLSIYISFFFLLHWFFLIFLYVRKYKEDAETYQQIYINALDRSESMTVSISKCWVFFYFSYSFFCYSMSALVDDMNGAVHQTRIKFKTIQKSRIIVPEWMQRWIWRHENFVTVY